MAGNQGDYGELVAAIMPFQSPGDGEKDAINVHYHIMHHAKAATNKGEEVKITATY